MTARIRLARSRQGTPLVRRIDFSDPALCRRCPDGIDAAFTVFIPGKGDSTDDQGMYEYDTEDQIQDFVEGLGTEIASGGPGGDTSGPYECCAHLVFRVTLDSDRTVRQNGQDLTSRLATLLRAAAQASGIRRLFVHLIGFSAGGLVAVEVARGLSDDVQRDGGDCSLRRRRPRQWCEREMPSRVPVKIDIVTIATPYDPSFLIDVGAALGMLLGGWPAEFCTSVGALDFGGGSRPVCVCNYVAIVTDDTDEEAGNQHPDDEVEDWSPHEMHITGATHMDRSRRSSTMRDSTTSSIRAATAPADLPDLARCEAQQLV